MRSAPAKGMRTRRTPSRRQASVLRADGRSRPAQAASALSMSVRPVPACSPSPANAHPARRRSMAAPPVPPRPWSARSAAAGRCLRDLHRRIRRPRDRRRLMRGGATSAWAIWIDTTIGCPPLGTASGAPWVPANSLTRPASGSPSAEKQGPDATSSNTSGACRRSRRLDGATVVHCCFRLLSTRCPPIDTITSVVRATTHVVARRAAGPRVPGDADPTYSRLRIA